jgi:lipopolysaccharide transport system permease protein
LRGRRRVITAGRDWRLPDLREVWAFRDLLWMLTWRDVQVRYKQTAIGILWAVIQPLFTMVVFTLVFGKLGKMPSEGIPYPVFLFAALLPWTLFAKALSQGSSSIVRLGSMMGKVYFPRLIAPFSSVLSGLVDFAVASVALGGLMIWYGTKLHWQLVFAPIFVGLALAVALAVSLWLSAVNAEYRDVQHALPFVIQIWMFLTPVIYPTSIVPGRWRWLYAFNPMVSAIEGFRWALLGGTPPNLTALALAASAILVLLFTGLVYFNRFEAQFVDRL